MYLGLVCDQDNGNLHWQYLHQFYYKNFLARKLTVLLNILCS